MSAICLASLEKPLKRGGSSIWRFMRDGDFFYAEKFDGSRRACRGVEDMRRFYKHMLGYGFTPIQEPADVVNA